MNQYYTGPARAKLEEVARTARASFEAVGRLDRRSQCLARRRPASSKAQELADRWQKLIVGFTGGDPDYCRRTRCPLQGPRILAARFSAANGAVRKQGRRGIHLQSSGNPQGREKSRARKQVVEWSPQSVGRSVEWGSTEEQELEPVAAVRPRPVSDAVRVIVRHATNQPASNAIKPSCQASRRTLKARA
jgi:hypothetical protein